MKYFIWCGDSGGPTHIEQDGLVYVIGPMGGTTLEISRRETPTKPDATLVTSFIDFINLDEQAINKANKFQYIMPSQSTHIVGKSIKNVAGTNPKYLLGYKKNI